MDSFSLLAAAAEAAHRDGYQVAVLARRSDSSQFSFRFDGINGKTSLLLKQLFVEISCTYAEDFTVYDHKTSISGSGTTTNLLRTSREEQRQSFTRAQLFLEVSKLFNVRMSLLGTKTSNTVMIECKTGLSGKREHDSKQVEVQNTKGDSLSPSRIASESPEYEPQTDCNLFSGNEANENTTSKVSSRLPPQQKDLADLIDTDDARTEDSSVEESESIQDDPFKPSAAKLPTADKSIKTPHISKYGPTKLQSQRLLDGLAGKKNAFLRFQCPHCPVMPKSRASLKVHIDAVHNKIKGFQCPDCSYAASYPSDLKRHRMAIHDKVRSFQCERCDSAFISNFRLKRHVSNVHEKARPHLCEECGECFSESNHLKVHKRKHTGDKLQCGICSFSTIYDQTMREHIRLKHQTEDTTGLLHKCSECEYITARGGNLLQHVARMHRKPPMSL